MERTDKEDSPGNRPSSRKKKSRSNSCIQESPHIIYTLSEQGKKDYYLSLAARDKAYVESQEGWFCKVCNTLFSYEPPKEIDHRKWSKNRVENRLKNNKTVSETVFR